MQNTFSSPHRERSLPLTGGAGGGLILSSAYLAPVHYYTKLYQCAQTGVPVIEEQAEHYVKQTYRNRCIIAADSGPVALTIPVTPPTPRAGGAECLVSDSISTDGVTTPPARGAEGVGGVSLSKTPMHSVVISHQGNWRHQHWQTIVSAYSSSPFFEYYADDFYRVFHDETALLADFNAALRDLVLDCLDLHPNIINNTERYITPPPPAPRTGGEECTASEGDAETEVSTPPVRGAGGGEGRGFDYRESIRPKIPYTFDPTFRPVPYWQVFASRHGFLPNLSIIDLLFNMGPESRLVLRDSCKTL